MTAGAAKWVWANSRASNGSLLVLLAIADECGKEGTAEMKVAEIAAKSRLSERAVQTALRDLTALGEISVAIKAGAGGRNRYALCMPGGAESAPYPAESAPPPQNLHPAESAPPNRTPPRSASEGADSAPPQTSDESSTTGLPVVENLSSEQPATRSDVDRLCTRLADRIEANGSRRPNITKRWKDAARRMIDIDGRTEEQVMRAIDWCQKDEFWSANILSMPKLRDKYDQLRMKATIEQRRGNGHAARSNPDDDYASALKRIQARKGSENGTRGDRDNRPDGQVSLPPAADRPNHLRDVASRNRPPGIHRRAGRRHRYRPFGEILLRR